MIDPVFIDSIAKLGALGFTIIALAGLYLGKVRREGEVIALGAVWAERLGEARVDRDEWRALAKSFGGKVDRLTDVVELLTGQKVGA